MYKVGEFSKLSGLSINTLYHYEKKNILVPCRIDKFTGYRYYEAQQLVTANKILVLKDANFSLEEIAGILCKSVTISDLIEILEVKAQTFEDALVTQVNRLERLHTNIFLLKNGGIPLIDEITIKSVEPILVSSIRKSFDKSQFDEMLELMWNDVNKYIDKKGVKRTIPCMMLYHSGWWALDNSETIDVEVVEPITKTFEGNKAIFVYKLPMVEQMACIVHKGSFSTINKPSEALVKWIRKNNYSIVGPIREIYHKGEWITNNPDEYVTELQIPVR